MARKPSNHSAWGTQLHSWGIQDWPPTVYPHSVSRARYLVRAQRDALIREGALTRVGRDLVIIGAKYTRFLEKGCSRVAEFDCPANRDRHEGGVRDEKGIKSRDNK